MRTVCGLVLSLSLTVTKPPSPPGPVMPCGAQETVIPQDCPAPMLVPQVLLSENHIPLSVMLSMVRLVLRLLVTVTDSGELQAHMFLTGSD